MACYTIFVVEHLQRSQTLAAQPKLKPKPADEGRAHTIESRTTMADSSSIASKGKSGLRRAGGTASQAPNAERSGRFSRIALPSPACLIVFILFVFVPLLRTVRSSMYLTDPIGPGRWSSRWAYCRIAIVSTPDFLNSLQRSVLFVLYTVPITLVLSMILALLGNLRLKRIDVFRWSSRSPSLCRPPRLR